MFGLLFRRSDVQPANMCWPHQMFALTAAWATSKYRTCLRQDFYLINSGERSDAVVKNDLHYFHPTWVFFLVLVEFSDG